MADACHIAGRERTDDGLRVASERLALAIRVSGIGVWEADFPDGVIENARFRRINFEQFGLDGQTTWDEALQVVHPDDRERVLRTLRAYLAGELPQYEVQHRFRRPDGSEGWIESRGAVTRDAAGKLVRLTGTALDITDRKHAEERLRAAHAQAESANRAKDEFLSVLGHELRTPLAPILLWARALQAGQVAAADMPRAFDSIVASAESQLRLIEDLLDLTRITAGRMSLNRTLADVASLAHAAAEVVRPAAAAKNQQLGVETAGAPLVARVDRKRFQQILCHMLSNAVKFTPPGGHLRLRIFGEGQEIVAQAEDDGEGLSGELLANPFVRFRQGNMGDDRPYGGLGIGLALCKELVDLHHGTIEARSEGPGRGSVFTVRIPRDPGMLAGDPAVLPLTGAHVVVVEERAQPRDALVEMLQRAGAVVRAVSTADEALQAIDMRWSSRDVLVCAFGMPGVDGPALLRRVHDRNRARGAPLTPACAVGGDRERAIDAGFDVYVSEAASAEELICAVQDLIALAEDGRAASPGLL